jgi:glycosyltransferase 2 family protein
MKRLKKPFSLAVSVIILLIIYSKLDVQGLVKVFQNCDRLWMVISLGMVVPLTVATAWRLQQMMPPGSRLGTGEANRLILAASTLNMVLPSKMGDIAKAYFMRDRGYLSGSLSLSVVVFEKTCDMLSLLLWCGFGLLLYPQKDLFFWLMTVSIVGGLILGLLLLGSQPFAEFFITGFQRIAPKKMKLKLEKLKTSWNEVHEYFWGNRKQLAVIAGSSVFIWLLHMVQIWFFILALKAWAPFITSLALSPLAILAGLLPLTFAGVGTRDAALILLYTPYFNAPTAAALGLLCTSRYLLPAIGGLPFLRKYIVNLGNRPLSQT